VIRRVEASDLTDAIVRPYTPDCGKEMPAPPQVQSRPKLNRRSVMVTIRPTDSTDVPNLAASSTPLFYAAAGWLAIAAGTLLVIGQAIWWPFDQQGNVATSQNNIFNAGTVIYLAGFCVLMFALIGVHGRQAYRAGRLGTFGFSAAVLGTMLFGGDLWFESFAVPWLAEGPFPEVLKSNPSMLFALGAIVSSWLFAIGWVAFGLVSLRARVFPVWISLFVVAGGIAGYKALLAPWGFLLGLAMAALGVWLVRGQRSPSTTESLEERPAAVM
jgi:hypothetical protein